MNNKIYEPIAPFKDHQNCKGHGNYMLDCTFETREERDMMIRVLDNHIIKDGE